MIKRILILILFFVCSPPVFAGALFNVAATGPSAQISMTLCLNGKGPLSCQTYTASAVNFSITTTIPNHTYPAAGIKINTPGYTPTGCTMSSNGYCLFTVSNTNAATISATSPACQPDVMVFSPAVTKVNNPLGNTSNAAQQFTINMTMCNSQGQPITPGANNPIHVDVYGAPNGVISPTSTTTSTGSVTFTYSGQAFPNNISINAWISDSSNKGAALGVTQVLKQNTPPSCTYGSTSYQVPLVGTLPNALQVQADVGYNATSPETSLSFYTIDTGSLGVVVPVSELPSNANVIGPGAPGVKYYDSSGNTYSGNYYLAPVRVKLASGVVQTQPIMVLGINKAFCTGPTTKSCYSQPPSPTLHYLGVGFNRNSTTTGDLFNSPTANAFLHITDASNGTDLSPGYYLTPSDATPTGLTLGITTSNNYNIVNLTPNPAVPGDFNPQAGCFSFPDSPQPNQFCGTALLDVGIDSMFIELPKAQWPAGTHNADNDVPVGVNMSILMGAVSAPALEYSFSAVDGNPPAYSPTPTVAQWVDSTGTGQIFVNTGRRPLYIYDYLYDGQCGQVGFKPLA
ncbi:MAG: hypothetical protein P4M14_00090 [Gammaproteobacteria bacterium]|nr:hypothetical protein [Gammaproteobacteria bacterium]